MHIYCNRSSIIQKGNSPTISVRNRRSMTLHDFQIIPPKRQTKTFQQIQQEILKNHKSINGIINKFKELVAEKLQAQQMQLLSTFKNTIDSMMIEVQRVVQEYKQALAYIQKQPKINKLQNQLNYFKAEALELFQINKVHKKQISELKKSINDFKIDKQVHMRTIQKLTKKVFRNKKKNDSILTDNTSRLIESLPFITNDASTGRYKSIKTQRIKTLGSIHVGKYD